MSYYKKLINFKKVSLNCPVRIEQTCSLRFNVAMKVDSITKECSQGNCPFYYWLNEQRKATEEFYNRP